MLETSAEKTDASGDIQQRLPLDLNNILKHAHYKPIVLMREIGICTRQAREKDLIDPIYQAAMDENLNKLSDIVGGCERIASTPIPYTYQVLLLITVFIGYTFVAFEAIADELEDPFGTEPNDLALNAMCRMIETTLLEMAGRPLPVPVFDNNYVID